MKGSDRINGFFKAHGLRQKDVAEIIGKTQRAVCDKVRKNSFETRELRAVFDYLNARGEMVEPWEVYNSFFGRLAS